MHLKQLLASSVVSSSLLSLALCGAQAATVNISGATPAFFPGFGTAIPQNNVISSGTSGVTGVDGSTFKGSATNNPAVVTTDLPTYNVDWYFVGAESGFMNTLTAPGINPAGSLPNSPTPGKFNENNQNNNVGGPAIPGVLFLGTSLAQTSTVLSFTLSDDHGATVTNGNSNPKPGTNGLPSIVFSYLLQTGPAAWTLTNTITQWFLFAFNDKGGPDDNHDDFIGLARVYAPNQGPGLETPLPGALVLFGSALFGMTILGRRRKAQRPVT